MISVCMATHNGEKYIKEQIDSILCQLGPDDELIISDDNSTDNTLNIIISINDNRIKLLNHNPADGSSFVKVTRNFENALRYAKGDYIFLSDQDDIWNPDKVRISINYLQHYWCIKHKYSVKTDVVNKQLYWKKTRYTLLGNLLYLPFHGCCMAFRRELLKVIIPIPNGVLVHDAWIGCLAFLYKKYIVVDDKLIDYRIHSNNVSIGTNNRIYFKIKYRIVLIYNVIKRYLETNYSKF